MLCLGSKKIFLWFKLKTMASWKKKKGSSKEEDAEDAVSQHALGKDTTLLFPSPLVFSLQWKVSVHLEQQGKHTWHWQLYEGFLDHKTVWKFLCTNQYVKMAKLTHRVPKPNTISKHCSVFILVELEHGFPLHRMNPNTSSKISKKKILLKAPWKTSIFVQHENDMLAQLLVCLFY